MKLFTKEVDKQLFAQYPKGSDIDNQMVVAKIFNPYGRGVWYLLNSDPEDPDYIWAIVDLFEPEMGSVSRSELQTVKVPPFGLGLERDIYFTPKPAKEVFEGVLSGKRYAAGGMTPGRYYKDNSGNELRYVGESQGKLLFKDGEKIVTKSEEDFEDRPKETKLFGFFEKGGEIAQENNEMLQSNIVELKHHADELDKIVTNKTEVEPWVIAKTERASTDLSDVTHYLDGEKKKGLKMPFEKGGYMADGGQVYNQPLNRATNLKVRDYLEKEGLSKQETGADYEFFLGQALVTSLRDSNFSKEANEIIYILDKSVKGDEVYDTKYYNPIPSIVRIGKKVAKICNYSAVQITDAYFFVSKMYGSGSLANAIGKVFGRYELSGKFKYAHGGETKGKRYKVNVYYGGEMEDEEFYTNSLDEAKRVSQGGEHSEIYDNHKKEFVEIEYAKGGTTKRTVKLTLSDKDSYDYTYKQDGATASITFGFGKEPFQYEVKKISKSLEPLKQDILDAFTIQGIKQHEYKGGFSEAIKHLDTSILYGDKQFAKGGDIYDDMDEDIEVANKKATYLFEVLKGSGYKPYNLQKANYDSDASIEISKKTQVSVSLDGEIAIVTEEGDGKFRFIDAGTSISSMLQTLKGLDKKYLEKGGYMAKGGTTESYEVELSAESNPDYDKSSYEGSVNIKSHKVKAKSIEEAREIVVAFIMENDLGSGNWSGGNVYKNGKKIGHVSYNGRYWDDTKMADGGIVDSIIKIDLSKYIKGKISQEDKKNAVDTLNDFFEENKIHPKVGISYPDIIKIYPENNNQLSLIKNMVEDLGYDDFSISSPIEYFLEWKDSENDEFNGSYQTWEEALAEIRWIKENGMRITDRAKYFVDADGNGTRIGTFADGGKLVGKQKNLDVNKNGKLDAEDFKMLRGEKMADGGKINIGTIKKTDTDVLFDKQSGTFYVNLIDGAGNRVNKVNVNTIDDVFEKYPTFKLNTIGQKQFPDSMADGGMSDTMEQVMTFEEFKKKLPILHDIKWGDNGVEYKPKYNKYSGTIMYFKHGRTNSEKVSLSEAYKHYKYFLEKGEEYAMGGKVKFEDKVKSIKESLLKRKKVSPKVQKDYGKTYSPKEAEESAKRIAASQRMKYELKKKFKKGGKTIAQTPAPKKDRVFGSSKNKPGSASSKKSASNIELNESIVKTLTEKAKEYNEKHSSKVSTSTLKAVMRRGMGAYSTSHRPTITGGAPNSRQAWGFARVNKFLKKKGGAQVKAAYVQDDDLL